MALPPFNKSDLKFIQETRRSRVIVTPYGRLEVSFAISDEYAAKQLRDLIIRESDAPDTEETQR